MVAALARVAADRAVRTLNESEPDEAIAASGRMVLLPLLGWLAALWGFNWATLVAGTVPKTWFMARYVALFLPLFLLFASTWTAARRVEARLVPGAPTPWGAVRRGLRRNVIVLAPLGVLLALTDAATLLAEWNVAGVRTLRDWHDAFPDVEAVFTLLLLAFLALFAPALFRRAMKASPLEPGDMRRSLEALAARLGLRCRDFLVWRTNGRVVNAMVVGMTPRTRYVFVTDALLATLSPAEVLAVVAHEAGHAKRNHLATYFVVALALFLVWRSAEEVVPPWAGATGAILIMAAFLGVFWFGVLGWLSRRFERQADAFAADNGSALEPGAPAVAVAGVDLPVPYGAALMISVLRRLERAVGPSRHHRHAHPRERTAFLAAYATDPGVRESFRRDSRRIALAIAALVVLAVAATAARMPMALARGEAKLDALKGDEARKDADAARRRGDAPAAREGYRRARALYLEAESVLSRRPGDPIVVLMASFGAAMAADLDLRYFSAPAAAAAGYERALRTAEGLRAPGAAEIRFAAHVELGRLALRDPDAALAVSRARRHLEAAKAVPEDDYDAEIRQARTRLLESAIRLRDPDPEKSAVARRDLEAQARGTAAGEEWEELREDAQEELRLATAK